MPAEGYVLHSYGSEEYLRHAVASVTTLRRYDEARPVALFCTPEHQTILEQRGLASLFDVIELLPEAHRSIVGFKHHLYRFMPFERSLFLDTDMVWCRDPEPLWQQLAAYRFTATGLDRADFFFGGPKGGGIFFDILLNRRRRTMRRFGLTALPRVQAGMIFTQDQALTEEVCRTAAGFLAQRAQTHFRSRLHEGRSEESCEWSLAMAMSRLALPVLPWYQGHQSPQLDYVADWTEHDPDFRQVACRFYCDRFIYELRSLPAPGFRNAALRLAIWLLRRPDYLLVTPFVLHFGSLREKKPFYEFSARTWSRLTQQQPQPALSE